MVSGCSTANSGSNGSSGNDGGKVKVVATTDVYADIVKQVGGDNVDVTPIIASTSTDPHSYEATAADRVKTKDAGLVVVNGGGYDQFLEDMAGMIISPKTTRTVIMTMKTVKNINTPTSLTNTSGTTSTP